MSEDQQKINLADHDLLIRIDENVKGFIEQFNEHKDYAIKQMADLNAKKLNKEDHNNIILDDKIIKKDIETRVRRLEKWGAVATGIILVIQFLISVFK